MIELISFSSKATWRIDWDIFNYDIVTDEIVFVLFDCDDMKSLIKFIWIIQKHCAHWQTNWQTIYRQSQ